MRRWWVFGVGAVVGVGYAMLPGMVASRLGQAGAREHAVGFAALTAAGVWAAGWRRWWMVAAATLGLGMAVEVAQRWVPGRGFEWMDLWADLAGVLVGAAIGAAGAAIHRGSE